MGGIDSKINVFRERYMAVWQRTVRHEMFTPAHRKAQSAQFSLQKIEYLKGITIKMTECVILGMLTQMKEGEWWIEDPTGALKLNLENASFHKARVSILHCTKFNTYYKIVKKYRIEWSVPRIWLG